VPDEEIGARLSLKNRREFSSDAQRAARDIDNIGDAAKRAERKGRDAGGVFSTLGRTLGGIGRTATIGFGIVGAVGVAGVGMLGAMGVQALIAAEQTEVGFTTMLGSAEKARQFMLDLEAFAAKTPFEMQGLTSAAQGLLAFGFGAEEILPMLTAVGDAAGGLSAGTEGINRMTRVLGQIKAKGKATTEDLMQLAEIGIPVWDILAKKIGTDIPTAMEKVTKGEIDAQTTIDGLLAGMTERFGGLMDKQSNTIGGLWSTLMDTIRIKSKNVMEPFADEMRSGIKWTTALAERFGTWAVREVPAFVDNVRKQIPNLIPAFRAEGTYGLAEVLDNMLGNTGKLIDPLMYVLDIFMDIGEIVKKLVVPAFKDVSKVMPNFLQPMKMARSVLGWVADNAKTLRPVLGALLAGFLAYKVVSGIIGAVTAAQAALNAVMMMNPIVLIVAALAALAYGLVYAYNHSETFRNAVQWLWDKIVSVYNWIKNNWPLLLAILTGPFGLAALWIQDNWNEIVTFFTGLPQRLKDAAGGMWDWMKTAFANVINFIIRAWNSLQFKLPSFGGWEVAGKTIIPSWEGPTLGVPTIKEIATAHTGAVITAGGAVKIQPDEEIVTLPSSASVVPVPDGMIPLDVLGGSGRGPVTVQLVMDRRVVAEAVYDETKDRLARR